MQSRIDLGEVITAMVTPFNNNHEIDYEAAEKLAKYLVKNGSDAILVAGTTGESPTLTHEEEYELFYCVRSAVGKSVKIILGAGSNSTQTAIMNTKKAKELGADAVLSVVPYYNKPSQKGIYQHFSKIAQCSDIPVILYNIPSRTGVCMNNDTIIKLSDDFKNIVAVKQSISDLDVISDLRMRVSEDFVIYCGDDSLTLPMLSLGAAGVISVASHIAGKDIKSMIHNFKNGNVVVSKNMHLKLLPLFKKLFFVPNPVPVKEALSRMQLIQNFVREPLLVLDETEKLELFSSINSFLYENQSFTENR